LFLDVLKRKYIFRIGAVVAAALCFNLFMQVAYACPMPPQRAAMAFDADSQGDCHAKINPNQCLSQCTVLDQVNGGADLNPPIAVLTVAVLFVPVEALPRRANEFARTASPPFATPPPTILYCSLLL
jgi:hypothetical protein